MLSSKNGIFAAAVALSLSACERVELIPPAPNPYETEATEPVDGSIDDVIGTVGNIPAILQLPNLLNL